MNRKKFLTSLLALGMVLSVSQIATAQAAADLYKTKCLTCHGADGKGDTAVGKKMGARDFHSPEVAKESDTELFDITKKGKNKMPSYDKKLTDDQIKDLIKYIHTIK